ncbi:hypothetical protein PGTUg99_029683 [Puccinia graminis f. sp. tritici]|uniref:Uncharacterized protein n=1 Tax=Puccinia graminis f. sp. tritici TaxID=56615 RepID=A0A5B0RU43_PUCGR|nr:hypothetical protein PGTUg99_029683 [Puccinia graminis f. sp. tritici]
MFHRKALAVGNANVKDPNELRDQQQIGPAFDLERQSLDNMNQEHRVNLDSRTCDHGKEIQDNKEVKTLEN